MNQFFLLYAYIYTSWMSVGDWAQEGDGRRLDCGAGRARFVRLLRRVRRPRRG